MFYMFRNLNTKYYVTKNKFIIHRERNYYIYIKNCFIILTLLYLQIFMQAARVLTQIDAYKNNKKTTNDPS